MLGLGQANKIDPATKEKEECREWLNVSAVLINLSVSNLPIYIYANPLHLVQARLVFLFYFQFKSQEVL